MALMIIASDIKVNSWVKHLSRLDPGIDIRVWPEVGNASDITFALCWNHPPGEFKKYKNLKCIASLGAGVDHIIRDPDLPAGVPITRVVEHSMAQSMSEYAILAVLNYCRQFDSYRTNQSQKKWRPRIPLLAADMRIGIMGLGQLGKEAAKKLSFLGFPVIGWSQTPKDIDGVKCLAGDEALDDFLSQARILICMLPLTPKTKGILNQKTFEKLPAGAYVINIARGQHLIEKDLVAALDSGKLAGACLDVFEVEPLPEDHPFWSHPKIFITPHISSITYPKAVAPQIIENYQRTKTGSCLLASRLFRRDWFLVFQRCWISRLILYCLWVTNLRSVALVPSKPLGEDGILNKNPIFEMGSRSVSKGLALKTDDLKSGYQQLKIGLGNPLPGGGRPELK